MRPVASVAWKRLNNTDHENIKGGFAGASGGGATYIVLGRSRPGQDFAGFFPALDNQNRVIIQTPAGPIPITSDPGRRNGEWLIVDQRGNRFPGWSTAAGFPTNFDAKDPTVIVIIKQAGGFRAGWLRQSEFAQLAPGLAAQVRGVDAAPPALLAKFGMQLSALDVFVKEAPQAPAAPPFNPQSHEDARKKVIAEIVRRQGQAGFRKALLDSYSSVCAITGCTVPWVLEAAHISPYRGPETNKPDNGLLLRADIHTLFDLGLVSVNPDTLVVRVAMQVVEIEYRALDGKSLRKSKVPPSKPALRDHWQRSTA